MPCWDLINIVVTVLVKSYSLATKHTPVFLPSIAAGVPLEKELLHWVEWSAATVRPSHKRLSIYYIKSHLYTTFFQNKLNDNEKRDIQPKAETFEWKVYNSISKNVISSNFSLYSQSTGDSFNLLSGCSNLLILTAFNFTVRPEKFYDVGIIK